LVSTRWSRSYYANSGGLAIKRIKIILQANHEPIELYTDRTALVVVDMQNGFVKKGGMLDLCGMGISQNQIIIESCKNAICAGRKVERRALGSSICNMGILQTCLTPEVLIHQIGIKNLH
jgi:hypothetical protein